MREITLYIYNDTNAPIWEMEVCGACGQKLLEVKGILVRRVSGYGVPQQVFTAATAYVSVVCRRCHTRNNILVTSFTP
jgi:hypothetical protein